jgi:hypothetical protein
MGFSNSAFFCSKFAFFSSFLISWYAWLILTSPVESFCFTSGVALASMCFTFEIVSCETLQPLQVLFLCAIQETLIHVRFLTSFFLIFSFAFSA